MQLRNSIALSLLATNALADVHHAHKREADAAVEYVTLFETHYVTAGANGAPTTVSGASAASEVAGKSAESVVVPVTTVSSDKGTAAASSSSTKVSSSAPSASSASGSAGSSSSVGSAGALGITYSPYSNSGQCKSTDQIASEVAKLSGYSIIRLYGVDCSQVSAVYKAKAANQKLFLGVYDVGNIANDIQTMNDAINGDWSSVDTVSVGNELVNSGKASVSDIAGYVSTARTKLSSLGYTGPVVAVDTFIATINNPGLCEISDYMAVNAHAYFDGGVSSSEAGEWALQQVQRVWSACGGKKKVTIVESGWPSSGDTNGKAVASPSDQAAAIKSLKEKVGSSCFLFTAYNDLWKSPGYLNVEQWWGLYGTSSN